MKELIPVERIVAKIYLIRDTKVMLDRDLAELYGVETRTLKQAVRRNIKRFPPDFMFELTKEEFANWRSQIVMSNADKMGLRHPPMAFTEQGVAMLSSVLKSDRAIQVNIHYSNGDCRFLKSHLFRIKAESAHQSHTNESIDNNPSALVLLPPKVAQKARLGNEALLENRTVNPLKTCSLLQLLETTAPYHMVIS